MAESTFRLDATQLDKLQQAMQQYQGDTEAAVNDVLHNQAPGLIQDSIRRLIPVSGREWKGKKPPAKTGNSLMSEPGNLSITVKNTKNYGYLYFPDDGTNTQNHAGNQQFFRRGGEAVQDEIIDRCINRLVENFEKEL